MARRYYASTAVPTTLTGSINSSATTVSVADLSGWPTAFPFTAVIDKDTVDEEIVDVVNSSGSNVTLVRGVDGTAPVAHNSGASFVHAVTGRDLNASSEHINATSDVHGVTGDLVGATTEQTLTNKTLSNPIISKIRNGPALINVPTSGTELVTTDGTQTLVNKTISGGNVNATSLQRNGDNAVTENSSQVVANKTLSNPVLSGNTTNQGTVSGGTVDVTNLRRGGLDVATISGVESLTNKTLVAPALTGAATLDGLPLATKRFSPVYDLVNIPTGSTLASLGAGIEASRLFVTPGSNTQVETMFSWYNTELTSGQAGNGDRLKICLKWKKVVGDATEHIFAQQSIEVNGEVYQPGGTIRGIFRPDISDPLMVFATLEVLATNGSGRYRIYANSEAPTVLSVRPTAL